MKDDGKNQTADDVENFFKIFKEGAFEKGIKAKRDEYEKRIRAVLEGQPIKPNDAKFLKGIQEDYIKKFGGTDFWSNPTPQKSSSEVSHEEDALRQWQVFQNDFRKSRSVIRDIVDSKNGGREPTDAQLENAKSSLLFLKSKADDIWEQFKDVYANTFEIDLDEQFEKAKKLNSSITRVDMLRPAVKESEGDVKYAVEFLGNIDGAVKSWNEESREKVYESIRAAGSDIQRIIFAVKSKQKGGEKGFCETSIARERHNGRSGKSQQRI